MKLRGSQPEGLETADHGNQYRILRAVKLHTPGHQFGGRNRKEVRNFLQAHRERRRRIRGVCGWRSHLQQERAGSVSGALGDLLDVGYQAILIISWEFNFR